MIPGILDDLKRDEGYRAKPYRDTEGVLTIGIGFNIDPEHPGCLAMPRDVATAWLGHIVLKTEGELDRAFPWWRNMNNPRQRAFLNMAYNLGLTRLSGFKKMIAALKKGNYEKAAREALDSKWAGQVGRRAIRIAQTFEFGN